MAKYVLLTKWSNRGGTPSVWFDIFPSVEDAAGRVEEYRDREFGSSYAMTDSVIVPGFAAEEAKTDQANAMNEFTEIARGG